MCTNTIISNFPFCLFFFLFPLEAILSCKHKFSKGMSLRIEWKKIQSQGVSFVYYNSEFTGTVLQTDGWFNMSFSSVAIDS